MSFLTAFYPRVFSILSVLYKLTFIIYFIYDHIWEHEDNCHCLKFINLTEWHPFIGSQKKIETDGIPNMAYWILNTWDSIPFVNTSFCILDEIESKIRANSSKKKVRNAWRLNREEHALIVSKYNSYVFTMSKRSTYGIMAHNGSTTREKRF